MFVGCDAKALVPLRPVRRIMHFLVLLLLVIIGGVASFSIARTSASLPCPRTGSALDARTTVSPLFIGTGFSFDDGNQVLVSVQKPLGIILEQDDDETSSIVVVDVDASGSAARAGVKEGDVLVAVQNAIVEGKSLEYALNFIGQAPRVVNLRFMRKSDD